MKVALIPPIPDLRRMPRTGIHLLLAHLFHDPEYLGFYQEARKSGDYLILDNSAHEIGIGEKEQTLLEKAALVGAQEVAVPDVLFDRHATIERSKRLLKYISGPGKNAYKEAGCPRLMLVPQAGQERLEWGVCLRSLLDLWDQYAGKIDDMESPVIGISKDYDTWRGGLPRLIHDFVEPIFDQRDFDVHLLGWANNLWSTATIAREYPWVRSTDSAKPFVYAQHGIKLEPGGKIPRYPRRMGSYFSKPLSESHWAIAEINIAVYKAAAVDELIVPTN